MLLVVALPDLALRLSNLLSGARYVVRVSDGEDLRGKVRGHRPDIVLLDWRVGGNAWRAIDEVSAIVEETESRPYVIALLPSASRVVQAEAARIGCYDVINVSEGDADRKIAEAVEVARRARQVRRDELTHRRPDRRVMH